MRPHCLRTGTITDLKGFCEIPGWEREYLGGLLAGIKFFLNPAFSFI
jgi:hypothetical protein